MGILDTIRERLNLDGDGYYDDGPYEDDYEDDDEPEEQHGLLGNTPRPEAQSVSVLPRGGQYTRETYEPQAEPRGYTPSYTPSYDVQATRLTTPNDATYLAGRTPAGTLQPYVLRPVSYDDAQTVVRRVRTNQPVVLSFKATNVETAKRIFDFCAGLAMGVGGSIEELGDRCFAVLPAGAEISDAEMQKLVDAGVLSR